MHCSYMLLAHYLSGPVEVCNIGYTSETHFKLKSREISCVYNIRFSCLVVSKFCTEHGSITAVLYATFQNDRAIAKLVTGKQYFRRFQFKIRFGRISYIAQGHSARPLAHYTNWPSLRHSTYIMHFRLCLSVGRHSGWVLHKLITWDILTISLCLALFDIDHAHGQSHDCPNASEVFRGTWI